MKTRLTTLFLISASVAALGLAKGQLGSPMWQPFTAPLIEARELGYPLGTYYADEAITPALLFTSKNYFVHDLNGRSKGPIRPRYNERNPITYTSRTTGEMHFLYESGHFSFKTAGGGSETRRILGITYDSKNLYFCVWHSRPHVLEQDVLDLSKGRIGVIVFQATNGQFTQALPVFPDKEPAKIANQDNLEVGPLRLEKNALICYDQTFKFDQGRLIAPKTLPAPDQMLPTTVPSESNPFSKFSGPNGGFGF